MKRRLLLFLMCLSLMAGGGYARTIKGTVVEADNDEPIIGANVKCKEDPTKVVTTNFDGEFSINIPDDAKNLIISYIGMVTQDVPAVDGMVVRMVAESTNLDEVVVVGYGTTTKRKTTSSVSVIKAKDIEAVPVPNVSQALAGRAAGLIVQQSGGGLDAGSSLSIRGGGQPLFVIDNIISEKREFDNLNPADIESMSVLKDASATAIYGARAANGIIIVNTKRGEEGKVSVDYQFNYTLSQPADLPKKVDAYTGAFYQNRSYEYDGMTGPWTQEDFDLFRSGLDPQGHPDTDWQKEAMRSVAPEQRHLLTITGGSNVVKAYTALAYYDQESIYRTNSNTYKRYNARTNIEVNLKDIGLRVNTGLEAYITDRRDPSSSYYYVWSHIQNKFPWNCARNPFGQPYSGTNDNPLVDISSEGGYVKTHNTNVRGSINAQWDLPWVPGLRIQGIASYSILNVRSKNWNKQAHAYDWEGNPNTIPMPSLSKEANFYDFYNTQLLANYTRTINEVHNVEATVGIEASGSSYDQNSLARSQYVLDVDQIGAGPVSTATNGAEDGIQWRRASVIFHAHYDYAYRYLIEFSLRHDGTDNLPRNRRWGTFYSGSLGWAVSEENFWEGLRDYVNMFKIRGSYGEIGLDNVARYAYLTSYSLNNRGAYLGGQYYQTFNEGALPSPDLCWYTQHDFNIGFDFAAFNNALSGSFDYFYKSTKGYLASPSNVGYTSPLGLSLPMVKSDGESRRRGVDFTLQYNGNVGEVSYNIGGNLTFYDDRWNINPNEAETSLKNPYQRSTQVSMAYGNLYKNLGYYKNWEDVFNSPKRNGSANLQAGDLKFYDFNGDGKIDGSDQYRMGKSGSPQCNYGINADVRWRGFALSMLWQGATSYNMYLDKILMGGADANAIPVVYEFQKDVWAPDNTNSLYPRQHYSAGVTGNNNFVGTDFWLVDAKYIRLKNLTVGYDFKHKLLKNAGWLKKCYLSFTGYNLLTFSPAKKWGLDPESGQANGYTYPVSRVYTFSLNLGF